MPKLPIESMKAISNCIRENAPDTLYFFMALTPQDGEVSMITSTDDPNDMYQVVREVLDTAPQKPEHAVPADAPSWYKS